MLAKFNYFFWNLLKKCIFLVVKTIYDFKLVYLFLLFWKLIILDILNTKHFILTQKQHLFLVLT